MKKLILAFLSVIALASCGSKDLVSPNGLVAVEVQGNVLNINYRGVPVQQVCIGTADIVPSTGVTSGKVDYEMITGKRSHCTNAYAGRSYTSGDLVLELRAYNDGVAFRCNGVQPEISYLIPGDTHRWMQRLKADYESTFPLTDKAAEGSWGYPALVEWQDGIFGLITEAGIGRGQCGSFLRSAEGSDAYSLVLAEEDIELNSSPWRVMMLGSLADVVESTLVTDISEPCSYDDISWIEPGVSAWIYWSENHGSKDFQKVISFIDLAAEMHWPYNLIDWEWDEMANGGNIDDALAYAKSKGIKTNLWYNSGTSWIGPGAPGPQDRLLTAESREKEFTMLEQMGASGIKVDFFKDDKAATMDYYMDILEDAARHHLLVDFHGCTIPRGWQRTYPNMMSAEAVFGAEWYNNVPFMTALAASHNATLPFTRNVVGPMDYTPCTFTDSQHPHITTWAHELALPVLFESSLQHMADRPSAYLSLPQEVKDMLTGLPTTWDDTRLISGYPGKSAVIARRKADTWYVAGINGADQTSVLDVDLSGLGLEGKEMTLFTDGEEGHSLEVSYVSTSLKQIECLPMGGFVTVIRN